MLKDGEEDRTFPNVRVSGDQVVYIQYIVVLNVLNPLCVAILYLPESRDIYTKIIEYMNNKLL